MRRFRRALPAFLLALAAAAAAQPPDPLLARLRSSDPAERAAAARELGPLGPAGAARLVALLHDREPEVLEAAMIGLAGSPVERALPPLLFYALEGETLRLRLRAAQALAKLPTRDAAARFVAVLRGGRAAARVRAAFALGHLGDRTALGPLGGALADRELAVRAEAADALGRLRDPRSVAALGARLADEEPEVRAAAAEALGRIGDLAAGPALLKAFAKDPSDLVAAVEGKALERLLAKAADEAAGTSLVEAVAEACRAAAPAMRIRLIRWLGPAGGGAAEIAQAAAAKDAGLRAAAAEALAAPRARDAGPALERLARDVVPMVAARAVRSLRERRDADGLVRALASPAAAAREEAAVALGEPARAVPPAALVALLSDRAIEAAVAAAVSLGRRGEPAALAPLVALARHRDWRLRAAAADALARLRVREAVPTLIAALGDGDPSVRATARKGLEEATGQRHGDARDRWAAWWRTPGAPLTVRSRQEEKEETRRYGTSAGYAILRETDVWVVQGAYDHAEKILEDLRIPHTLARGQEVKKLALHPRGIVLVNCEGTVDEEGARRLEWFVRAGGLLVTTDWALQNSLERVFPGVIERYGKSSTGNDVVGIAPADPDEPLLAGIFRETSRLMWWLEVIAFPIEIADPFRARVVIRSLEMERKYGRGAAAVLFEEGHGRVLHLASHVFLQKEGIDRLGSAEDRMTFAADHLGVEPAEIRRLRDDGFFRNPDTSRVTKDYSAFTLITNLVREQRDRSR
jgi:HEAT repeat protein